MATEIDICNQAIAQVGGELILSLDDPQKEAVLCKLFYPKARDFVSEDARWSFLGSRVILSPSSSTPVFGFTNAFELPGETIEVYEVFDNDKYNPDIVENNLYWQREGNKILADAEKVYVKYKTKITDPSKFSTQFTQAVSAYLAHLLAIPITNNRNLSSDMYGLYGQLMTNAANTDAIQGRTRKFRASKLTNVRRF